MNRKVTCKHCGMLIPPRPGRGRPRLHCSAECRLAHHQASGGSHRAAVKYRHSDLGRQSARDYQRRKGQVGTAEQHEPSFDRYEIFERDHWRCQLCGRKVQDRAQQKLDAATVHLRKPTAAGGKYSLENGETACRECNGRAAALVARSLSDPSFALPRSLRLNEGYGASSRLGPLSTSMENFGSVPATSEAAEVSLVPVSPQRPQEGV